MLGGECIPKLVG